MDGEMAWGKMWWHFSGYGVEGGAGRSWWVHTLEKAGWPRLGIADVNIHMELVGSATIINLCFAAR